jgi:soluble lytic murein transglycosylase
MKIIIKSLKKIISRSLPLILIIIFLTVSSGCSQFKTSLLNRVEANASAGGSATDSQAGGSQSAVSSESVLQETSGTSIADMTTAAQETAAAPGTDDIQGSTAASDVAGDMSGTGNTNGTSGETSGGKTNSSGNTGFGITDPAKQRDYFKRGVESFEKQDYIMAEYYLNQIKDNYIILADHIFYYYAKCLLMEKKYEKAREYYLKLKSFYPDSIFSEKATLEYADLFFMTEDYKSAEAAYEKFIKDFPNSDLFPYCLFQLSVCQERNGKFSAAAENYKKIWLGYPQSEYSAASFNAIETLSEGGKVPVFTPTVEDFYSRGQVFYDLYIYESALAEYKVILDSAKSKAIDENLHMKTLYRMGMCYFNIRDYSAAKEYLLSSYKKSPSGVFADDNLYFLGRIDTNLDMDDSAIERYALLLEKFPSSNYADDALYRTGRIYFFKDDFENARKYFKRMVVEYPSGDKLPDAYWELGWIEYKLEDFTSAASTFDGMAGKFKGAMLGEKAMFWKAKSSEKLGDKEKALSIYKEIVSAKTYSYYTFAAKKCLEEAGQTVDLGTINKSVYPDNPQIGSLLPDVYNEIEANTTSGTVISDTSGNGSNSAESNDGTNTSDSTSGTSATAESTSSGNTSSKIIYSHLDKAKELLLIEFYKSADKEIEASHSQFENDNIGLLQLSTLYLKSMDYINSQKVISGNYTNLLNSLKSPYKDYLYYLIYPYAFPEYLKKYSAEFGVDPLYVLAVMREESRFDPEAGSYVGALGLMQVMPATGKGIANSLGIKNFNSQMLLDPETSVKMGCFYLGEQLKNFNGNNYYASGAYNGGPGAMSKWISEMGDKNIDEFIELIPYDETRNYIRKVMSSYFFYQMLYE